MGTGDILMAGSILVGALMVTLQLFLQRYWNRQKSTEEICNRFIEPDMYQHWNNIQTSVVEGRKKWDDISPNEQHSVRMLLSYFETLGVLVRHRVVDQDMVADLFANIISLLHDCTKEYLPKLRRLRKSDNVYCEFEYLVRKFGRRGRRPSQTL